MQVVVDSYSSGGIKSNGRWCWGNQHQIKRGAGERYVLLNIDIKVPYDLDNQLSVGENKKEFFKLIQRSVEDN